MNNSRIFQISLVTGAFLCSVAFGYVLLFDIVIMPGLADLDDGTYLLSFQAIDGVIQRGQPIFGITWVGPVVAIIVACITSHKHYNQDHHNGRAWFIGMILATIAFLIGQVCTAAGNIPLNNHVHTLDIENLDDSTLALERKNFERPWLIYNRIRTILFGFTSVFLVVALLYEPRPSEVTEENNNSSSNNSNNRITGNQASNYQSI